MFISFWIWYVVRKRWHIIGSDGPWWWAKSPIYLTHNGTSKQKWPVIWHGLHKWIEMYEYWNEIWHRHYSDLELFLYRKLKGCLRSQTQSGVLVISDWGGIKALWGKQIRSSMTVTGRESWLIPLCSLHTPNITLTVLLPIKMQQSKYL